MTYNEAASLRDTIYKKLVGQPLIGFNGRYIIKDVIVSDRQSVSKVYTTMWDNNLPNDTVLKSFQIEKDDYDVFVISHQWNLGSGDLLFESYENYSNR